MGILPLQFPAGASAATLGLTGRETLSVRGLDAGVTPGMEVTVEATAEDARAFSFPATVRIDGPAEVAYFERGGILRMVLLELLGRART